MIGVPFKRVFIFLSCFLLFGCEKSEEKYMDDHSLPTMSSSPVISKVQTLQPIKKESYLYKVINVIDGDTIVIRDFKNINNLDITVRMIGVNAPESSTLKTGYEECYGKESSLYAETQLLNSYVSIEQDSSQDIVDKYGRMLAHVFLENNENYQINAIKNGYAFSYIYNNPSQYQKEYEDAQLYAKNNLQGLWKSCDVLKKEVNIIGNANKDNKDNTSSDNINCEIKGNISNTGEKIYHTSECKNYLDIVIIEKNGERCFQSETEALSAGWRKARNCN